ncbi:hypothetical protein, conserved [Eimeria brunetti]|uniref:Uncharacterized protein n=1 Tax=Eimeria brunetti TaxID=51314 RepID=U6L6F9_9EIME|nr:hypothetical protein, conserved [Eimeria brunetti]
MARPTHKSLEPLSRGYLPGTRPLSVEEYECLATTHPYAVKHLVTKKGPPVLYGDAVTRLPAARVHSRTDAANGLEAENPCFGLGNAIQAKRFLVPDEHLRVRRNAAHTNARKEETKVHCVYTGRNGVDMNSYTSQMHSNEHHQAYNPEQSAADPVGEHQPASKLSRFPALDGPSIRHQSPQECDCYPSGDTEEHGGLCLHDGAAVPSPDHYCAGKVRQSKLHPCQCSVTCAGCSEQGVACSKGFIQLHSAKRPCPVHHNAQASSSSIMPLLATSPIGRHEDKLRDGESSPDAHYSGSYKIKRRSSVVLKNKGDEKSLTGRTYRRLPHRCESGPEDNLINVKRLSGEHYRHGLRRGKYNPLSPVKQSSQQCRKFSETNFEFQDVRYPGPDSPGIEAFLSENTGMKTHKLGLRGNTMLAGSETAFTLAKRVCIR